MGLPKPLPKSGGSASTGVSSESFLKVKAGEDVKAIFRGQPLIIYQRWPKGGQKEIFSTPEPGARPRYLMNVVIYDPANKRFVAKVWEMAAPTYDLLYKISEHFPLEKTKVLISRQGLDTNTKYTLLPLPHEPLSDAQMSQVDSVQLNVLSLPDQKSEPVKNHAPQATATDDEGLPF